MPINNLKENEKEVKDILDGVQRHPKIGNVISHDIEIMDLRQVLGQKLPEVKKERISRSESCI